MKAVEEYIKKHTRNCSNEILVNGDDSYTNIPSKGDYHPWLTPYHAECVAEIAREETIKEVCEWLDNHTVLSKKWYIEDLKKHLEDKV